MIGRVPLRHAALIVLVAAPLACGRSPQATPAPQPAPAVQPPPDSTPPDTARPVTDVAPAGVTVGGALTRPPELVAPKPLTVPPVVERRLENGLRLLVVEHHELPVVDFVLVVGTGAEADPRDRAGLATLTAALLDEGTDGRDALTIADQAAYLGIRVGTGSGWDASTISLSTPTARLDSALALFADIALRPSFATADLERLRQERLTQLVQLRDRGPAIADRVFPEVVYGAEHPYGRPLTGTRATTTAITAADVRRFYDSYFRPNNATLIVVGDVQPADVETRVRRLFGAWERQSVPASSASSAPTAVETRVHIVDRPGAAQTSVRIGAVGVPRSTDEYFPLLVMNTILGGSFTSRLNQNLRETHGYTYGAGSGFAMRREAGPFTARAEVVAAKTDSALIEFMTELRAIGDTVPAAELEKAKQYLQLQLPGAFETTGDIAGQLVPIALHGLPLDYFDSYSSKIARVGQADVQRVAREYVNPGRVSIVVVGDRASIEAAIRAAGLGETVVRPLPPQ